MVKINDKINVIYTTVYTKISIFLLNIVLDQFIKWKFG